MAGVGAYNRRVRPVALGLLLILLVGAAPAAGRERIFRLTDPFGDDRGAGSLRYPRRSDMNPGDLDLLEFTAERRGDFTVFQFVFARNIRKPGREAIDGIGTMQSDLARRGFYTFNIDLYIDTDGEPNSGELAMLPGRKAVVSAKHAWEKTVAIAPRPHTLRASIERAKFREWREEESERRSLSRPEIKQRRRQISEELIPLVYFPTRINVIGRRLDAWVPNAFLGGEAQPTWGYVVVITGARLEQRFRVPFFGPWSQESLDGMVLPVFPGSDEQAFGGGLEGEPLQPPLIDILVPEGTTQREVLSGFDSRRSRPAQLPGIVPADIAAPAERADGGEGESPGSR